MLQDDDMVQIKRSVTDFGYEKYQDEQLSTYYILSLLINHINYKLSCGSSKLHFMKWLFQPKLPQPSTSKIFLSERSMLPGEYSNH